MKYQFGKHLHLDTNKFYPTIIVQKPYEALSIISSLDIDELTYLINYLSGLLGGNIENFSEESSIQYQIFHFGSVKSKIIGIKNNLENNDAEFGTEDLLNLCTEWRDYISVSPFA